MYLIKTHDQMFVTSILSFFVVNQRMSVYWLFGKIMPTDFVLIVIHFSLYLFNIRYNCYLQNSECEVAQIHLASYFIIFVYFCCQF